MRKAILRVLFVLLPVVLPMMSFTTSANAESWPSPGESLSDDQVASFAQLALEGIPREYPNKPSNVMTGPESVLSPRQMHPVFFGSFDWHSSVHGHWMLVRLAKHYPQSPVNDEIRRLLDQQLTGDKLKVEAAYFEEKQNRSFERMYGWAWTLRLAAELHTWDDPDAKRWAQNLAPLEKKLVELTADYLPRLTYPIRTGEHPDTAFALGQVLDYARAVGNKPLVNQIINYARTKYLADRDYPAGYEPSGQDFFSPAWNEADLMRRVLPREEFAEWLEQFLPGLAEKPSATATLMQPAIVSDVTDGKLVHLVGLNLSRAWTQNGVLTALDESDPRRMVLQESVAAHSEAGLRYVFSGHYEGEHWLATFAVYLLTEAGLGEARIASPTPRPQP